MTVSLSSPQLSSSQTGSSPKSNSSSEFCLPEESLPEESSPEELLPELSSLNPNVFQAEQVLACDWRDLTHLGVSPAAARQIARTLIVKRLIGLYGRRLIQAQVPAEAAHRIARTVAKYDVLEILPTLPQQTLLRQHCPAVCRSGLWRVEMLLRVRSEEVGR